MSKWQYIELWTATEIADDAVDRALHGESPDEVSTWILKEMRKFAMTEDIICKGNTDVEKDDD